MKMSRRQAIVSLAVITALGASGPAAALLHRGGSVSIQGIFPNADPSFLPMRQVYPAPTGVQSYEGHQIAYYKPSTGDSCLYRTRPIATFGRWPYRYSLVSGPPGMAFVATTWSTAWDGQGDMAFKQGYGVLEWTPTAAISSSSPTTVSVDIEDQDGLILNVQWPIWTSDDVASGGVVAFLDSTNGNDTTGNGSKATPWQTLGKVCGINGGSGATGTAGCKCYLRGAPTTTTQYWLPPTSSSGPDLVVKATTTPATFIGYPGETATLDFTGTADSGAAAWYIAPSGPGLTFQDFSLNGYNTAQANIKLFSFSSVNRLTFLGIIGNNTGYGTSFTNNSSLFYGIGGSPNTGTYLTISGCEENNRQSNSGANNASIHELYSYQEFASELNSSNNAGNQLGNSLFSKSDIAYGCVRANLIVCASAVTGFSYFQCPYQNTTNCQSCYNVGVNINNLEVPGVSGYSYGNILANRNSIVSANGLVCNDPTVNMVGPYTHANVVSGTPSGLTIAAPSTSSTGGSLGAGPWYYGMTSIGVSGESTIFTTNGSNEVEITGLSGSTNQATLSFLPVPYANSTNLYRGTASATYTEVANIPAGVTQVTDTGSGVTWSDGSTSWNSTSGSPSSNTAVSASRFQFNNNCVQTTAAKPSGNTVTQTGNQYASSGLLNTTTGLLITSNGGLYGAQLI